MSKRIVSALEPRRNAQALRALPPPWSASAWSSVWLARAAIRRGATQKIRELAPLIALLHELRPEVVVEIGTAAGGTLYAWCRVAAPRAVVVSIDLPGARFSPNESPAERLRTYARESQELHLIRDDSHRPATKDALIAAVTGRNADFLFIDGDHTYDGVRSDFDMYAPLVRRGGIIAFHDIVPHPRDSGCEVHRFWKEIKSEYSTSEYVDRGGGSWGGIGVIRT